MYHVTDAYIDKILIVIFFLKYLEDRSLITYIEKNYSKY